MTDELISSADLLQTETDNQKPETENMEVHHHSHAHGKKTWREYFWEFLMLFLAVFCGFLAEYQLEHVIEHQREKEFINSMILDLKDDLQTMDKQNQFEITGISRLDTLINLLNDPGLAKANGDQLYYLARVGPRMGPLVNNSRTFDQLKNSGGFRLIRKKEAADRIMGYYSRFPLLRLVEDNYTREFDNYQKTASKVFDPVTFRKNENKDGNIIRGNENASLRSYDKELLKELGFYTVYMNGSRRSRLLFMTQLKQTCEELIRLLQQQYDTN